jgi:DNA-binding MarR family transcriptional regulator
MTDDMTNRSDGYEQLKLGNQLCFPLYAVSREIIKKYGPILKKIDLTYTQYLVMMVLWEEDTVNVKKLGEKLFLDSGTLSPVLKSLESKDLVSRSRSGEDERVLLISLSDKGRALKEQAKDIPFEISKCVDLSPEEACELGMILRKLLKKTQ